MANVSLLGGRPDTNDPGITRPLVVGSSPAAQGGGGNANTTGGLLPNQGSGNAAADMAKTMEAIEALKKIAAARSSSGSKGGGNAGIAGAGGASGGDIAPGAGITAGMA